MTLPSLLTEVQGIVYALILIDSLPSTKRTKSASHALHAVLETKLDEMEVFAETL